MALGAGRIPAAGRSLAAAHSSRSVPCGTESNFGHIQYSLNF